ncbi:hypothetical protein RvY_19531, partial [Ramazzottius varieornatus]
MDIPHTILADVFAYFELHFNFYFR